MFKNKEKVMARVAEMPRGEFSPSSHYWCVTCKMLFDIDKPVCPYMPKICINTPIPIETVAPETTSSLERFGLFYPKIPQKVMATPRNIKQAKYSLMDLMTVYQHTPDIYKRFIEPLPNHEKGRKHLKTLLEDQWLFELEDEPLSAIEKRLGLS